MSIPNLRCIPPYLKGAIILDKNFKSETIIIFNPRDWCQSGNGGISPVDVQDMSMRRKTTINFSYN